jgi:hypothetical protein
MHSRSHDSFRSCRRGRRRHERERKEEELVGHAVTAILTGRRPLIIHLTGD